MKMKDLQRNWQRMAEDDPLWAIATDPRYKGNKWELEAFFATGTREVEAALLHALAARPALQMRAAMDFGCGVGRLTQALGDQFETVTGVDIAPAMITKARDLNRHGDKVRYVLNARPDLAQLPSGSFDFVYSAITLQHMEPRYVKLYIAEFLRVLKPEGLALFQLPAPTSRQQIRDRIPRSIVYGLNRVRTVRTPMMEMYGIAPAEVVEVVERSGGVVLAEVELPTRLRGIVSDHRYAVVPVE